MLKRHFLTVTENAENGDVFVFIYCLCYKNEHSEERNASLANGTREGKDPSRNMKHAVFVLFWATTAIILTDGLVD